EAAQRLQPYRLIVAVGDRPLAAGERTRRVEIRPHLAHHLIRHEMGVHVDDRGQAEPTAEFGEVADGVVGHGASCALAGTSPAAGGYTAAAKSPTRLISRSKNSSGSVPTTMSA